MSKHILYSIYLCSLWNVWAWWPGQSSKPVCGRKNVRGGSIPHIHEYITEEYRLIFSPTEEDKEDHRQYPERFFRSLLQEAVYPLRINVVEVVCMPETSLLNELSRLEQYKLS